MANQDHDHLTILKRGVKVWNEWREEHPDIRPDLSFATLSEADLSGVNLNGANLRGIDLRESNLSEADLSEADLVGANFRGANFRGADLSGADLSGVDLREGDLYYSLRKAIDPWGEGPDPQMEETNFSRANLSRANLSGKDLSRINLSEADLRETNLRGANLSGKDLSRINLSEANLSEADLSEADLSGTDLRGANFRGANLSGQDLSNKNLSGTDLRGANLSGANLSGQDLNNKNLSGANLSGANLNETSLIKTNFSHANLSNCSIYGIAAWDIQLDEQTVQKNLIITPPDQPVITVDNLKIAQFIYLLLNNAEIREVIDTIAKKAVLILGRFTPERKAVLDALKEALRTHGYLPILFDFDKPSSQDFTETVSTLAHLSRFVVADLTDPSSIPQELYAIVPHRMVPVQPLLKESEDLNRKSREYSMFIDLRKKYHWILPTHRYKDLVDLLVSLQAKVISPAEQKAQELEKR